MNTFDKPKDWGVAPQNQWVSGTPIGQSEIRMPELGDPGSHENASQPVSFGDDDNDGMKTPSIWQGKMVNQCPAGTRSKKGLCTPDPESEAKPETRMEAVKKQFEKGATEGTGKPKRQQNSFKREIPKAPEMPNPVIERLRKREGN